MRYKKKYIPPKAIFEEIEGQDVMGTNTIGGTDGGMEPGEPKDPFDPNNPYDPFNPAKAASIFEDDTDF